MIHSIKRISKRTLSVILALMMVLSTLLVGMVTANAMTVNSAHIYFDNTTAQWSSVYLVIGKGSSGDSSYSSVYKMNTLSGTNLYYLNNTSWDGATYLSFICNSYQWGDGKWGTDNLANATYYTSSESFNIDSDNTYIAKPTSKQSKNTASGLTYYSNGYKAANNRTITLKTMIDGVVSSDTKPATLGINSYSLSDNGTIKNSSASGSLSASFTAAPGATTKLSYSNLSSDYEFVGWVDSSGTTVSESDTYSFSANNTTNTYYANFTSTEYKISAVAKYQSFNADTNSYNAVADASSSIGTASAAPTTVTPGSTTTLTAAAVGSDYEFVGWYSDPSCTTQISTDFECVQTPASSTTYYALFKQTYETKTLTVDENDAATVTVTYNGVTYNEKDTVTIPVGGTVTVNVSADDSAQYCSGVTAGSATVTGSNGTYTFKMPSTDTTVVATIADKQSATVTVSSSDTNLGSATATPNTGLYVGDTVTLKATATNGSFSNWTISGATYNSGYDKNDATVVVTITSSNVTATATFDAKTYSLNVYSTASSTTASSQIVMKESSIPGTYISTSTIGNNKYFTVERLSDNNFATNEADSSGWWINACNSSVSVGWSSKKSDSYNFYTNTGSAVYVVYNSSSDTIYLTTDPDVKYTVYAKNGTVRNDEGDFKVTATLQYGTTVVNGDYTATTTKATNNGTSYNAFNQYSIAGDTVITVTTTLKPTYKTAGFYVGAFCVNGKYLAATKMSDGVYTSDAYTLTAAEAINNSFEITPVYYNSNIDAAGDYITFYVDADEVTSSWGGTIAVDAYTYINGSTSSDDHLFGTYPGQPMVLQGKYYTIKVPKYRYYLSGSSYIKDSNSPISGITMTSYHADLVHYAVVEGASYGTTPWNNNNNFQTYDYSDFVNIAALDDVQTIMFENKYYDKDLSSSKDNSSVAKESSLGSSIGSLTTVNPWQKFADYYGKETGILGDVLSEDQLSDSKKLYIISVGNTNTQGKDYTTEGQWATMWYVYKQDGTYLTKGTPADFISSASTQYKAIVDAGYQYAQTKISYDMEKKSSVSGDSGVRSDGRWYYSKLGLEFNSSVEIEYIEHTGSGDVIYSDTNTNAENTGFVGETTNGSSATINNVTTATFTTVDTYPTLHVDVANGWVFEGWYIKETSDDDTVTYTKIGSTTTVNDFLMNNSYTIVARLDRVAEGDLVLTHTQYTGTNPAAHSGTGIYYISAIVSNSDGTIVQSFDETEGNINISGLTEEQNVTITIRTVCHGANTFWAWYEQDGSNYFEIADEDTDYRGASEGTYTFTLKAKNLFNPVTDKLYTNALNFYSDIVKVSGYCDITYYYFDRFSVNGTNQYASYIVRNVELSDDEIANNYTPSDATIMANAPEIDTMYVDTQWVLTGSKVEKGKSVATVYATQPDKDCLVIYPDITENSTSLEFTYESEIVKFNNWFVDDNNNFKLVAPETIVTKDADGNDVTNTFSYWEVFVVDSQGNLTKDVVTKCYERTFGLRIMGDYKIVPVYNVERAQITANISAPVYNREIMGESTNPTDRLYVDFLVAYTSTDVPIFNPTDNKYTNDLGYIVECGVIVDRNNDLSLTTEDREKIIAAAVSGGKNPWDGLEASYIEQFAADHDAASELAFDSQSGDKTKVTYTDTKGNEHRLSKYVLDNSTLTNKNRIDKVLVYTNNEANQNYIFTAYSYVIIRDTSGNIIASVISTADETQYYNLCYTGNTPYQKTATTE